MEYKDDLVAYLAFLLELNLSISPANNAKEFKGLPEAISIFFTPMQYEFTLAPP